MARGKSNGWFDVLHMSLPETGCNARSGTLELSCKGDEVGEVRRRGVFGRKEKKLGRPIKKNRVVRGGFGLVNSYVPRLRSVRLQQLGQQQDQLERRRKAAETICNENALRKRNLESSSMRSHYKSPQKSFPQKSLQQRKKPVGTASIHHEGLDEKEGSVDTQTFDRGRGDELVTMMRRNSKYVPLPCRSSKISAKGLVSRMRPRKESSDVPKRKSEAASRNSVARSPLKSAKEPSFKKSGVFRAFGKSIYESSKDTGFNAFQNLMLGRTGRSTGEPERPIWSSVCSVGDDVEEVATSLAKNDLEATASHNPSTAHKSIGSRGGLTEGFEASEDYVSPSDDVRLQKLTKDELAKVKALTTIVGKEEVRAEIPCANISLRGEDLARLRGCRWLNDELINSYISLINLRNREYFESQGSGASSKFNTRPRTFIFNTFFLTRLMQNTYDYNGVKRWTKRAGIDVLKLDRILIPVNLGSYHWLLAMIDFQKREFVYLDSMHAPDTHNILQVLRRWLKDELTDKKGAEKAKEMDLDTWANAINPTYLPLQRDEGSCGVFTVYMADYLELNKTPDFTQLDMRVLRQRMVLYFSKAELPGR